MKDNSKLPYLLLFVLALAVNFSGINVKFFTDDPGLYASIAKNLLYKHEFFQLFTYNRDWLDKPHFPFWAVLLSFKLFGVSVWAYRLPALLFFIISLFYTYLFTRKYYGWEIAIMAVLILMTALNIQMANTDVRAEPYLMALIIGSIYHISRLDERFTFGDFVMAALLTACAVMTKGIFVLVAIYGSLLGQLFFKRKLKSLFQLKWVLLFVLTIVFTLPELYALYVQFDLHPEKVVFERQHVSGLKWFLWDSQFGRFVNNGPITRKVSGSIFFYLHTLAWAFAPWVLLFYYAVYKNLNVFQNNKLKEYYAMSGGLLLLLLFSLSRFQLPFYTNAVFPLFAIITAPFCLTRLNTFGTKFRMIGQWIFIILLPVAIITVHILLKPASSLFFIVGCVVLVLVVVFVWMNAKEMHKKTFFINCAAVLFAGFYLNTVFYKEIVPYKGQIAAAEYINQKPFDIFHIYALTAENNIFQFYCKRPVDMLPIGQFSSFKSQGVSIFYVNQDAMNQLVQNHAEFKVLKSFVNYPHENILPKFIDKATRATVLDKVYLIYK